MYLDTYPGTPLQSTFNLTYVATRFTDKLQAKDDVASWHWVPLNDLPKHVAFPMMRKALNDLKDYLRR